MLRLKPGSLVRDAHAWAPGAYVLRQVLAANLGREMVPSRSPIAARLASNTLRVASRFAPRWHTTEHVDALAAADLGPVCCRHSAEFKPLTSVNERVRPKMMMGAHLNAANASGLSSEVRMYTNIMVAVDGSPSSKKALDEGLKMARLCGARLFAVFVVDKSILFAYGGRTEPAALLDEIRHYGKRILRSADRAISHAGVNGETEIVETDIGQDVVERLQRYVVDRSIDLAAIGTHGRRGIRRMLLGSVAERFLRESRCPVLLVRDEGPTPAAVAA